MPYNNNVYAETKGQPVMLYEVMFCDPNDKNFVTTQTVDASNIVNAAKAAVDEFRHDKILGIRLIPNINKYNKSNEAADTIVLASNEHVKY